MAGMAGKYNIFTNLDLNNNNIENINNISEVNTIKNKTSIKTESPEISLVTPAIADPNHKFREQIAINNTTGEINIKSEGVSTSEKGKINEIASIINLQTDASGSKSKVEIKDTSINNIIKESSAEVTSLKLSTTAAALSSKAASINGSTSVSISTNSKIKEAGSLSIIGPRISIEANTNKTENTSLISAEKLNANSSLIIQNKIEIFCDRDTIVFGNLEATE